jgi:hypothetical protein
VLGERCNTLVGEHKKNVKQIKTTIMKINQIILPRAENSLPRCGRLKTTDWE